MSNEALALLAKENDRQAITDLWEQTHRLIYSLLVRYFPLCGRCGVEPDDLRQSGFFALLRAVNAYDPARGFMFTSYLEFHVSNVARETLGYTDARTKLPPVPKSLSEPITEDGGTLADILPDPSSDFADVLTDQVAHRQSVAALRAEVDKLPDEPRQALLSCLWEGNTLKETAAALGLSFQRVQQLRNQGLRKLRSTKTVRAIERELYPPRHVSLAQFRVDHTSQQEKYLLWLEERIERRKSVEQ